MKFDLGSTWASSNRQKYQLLAPAKWTPDGRFSAVHYDPARHGSLTRGMQRFRGSIYLLDGALQRRQLTSDGLHIQDVDKDSWHLLTVDEQEEVVGCARYYAAEQPSFDGTGVAHSALAHCPHWKDKVRAGVRQTIEEARLRGMRFAELGGWCVGGALRNSPEALRTVLRMFALGEKLGGAIGLSTATTRHSSASILKRLGAEKMQVGCEEIPTYFDPGFDCDMELLRFDSSRPMPRYEKQILEYKKQIETEIAVICNVRTWEANESLIQLHHSVGETGQWARAAAGGA